MITDEIKFRITENEFEIAGENLVKLNSLKRIYFRSNSNRDKNYIDLLKESSKFYHFQLPPKFCEFFLSEYEQPIFWILESPLSQACEEYLRATGKLRQSESDNISVKQYFYKWAAAKSEPQKKMFAAPIIKLIKNSSDKNIFLDRIYYSLVLIYDRHFKEINIAIDQLTLIDEEIISSGLPVKLKDDMSYLIKLYKGFADYLSDNYESAAQIFSEAVLQNVNGITAKFFLASCYAKLNETLKASEILKSVFNYDVSRLTYSIETNNASLLNYFLKTTIFSHIFYYPEFGFLSDYIEQEVILPFIRKSEPLPDIGEQFDKLIGFELDEFYDTEIKNSIQFITKTFSEKSSDQNPFYKAVQKSIVKKYESLLERLKDLVREKINGEFQAELSIYDKKISEVKNLVEQLGQELTDFKEENKKRHNISVSLIEDYIRQRIKEVEDTLNNIHLVNSLSPSASFRSSMTYNFIISIVVLTIGCIAGYSNHSAEFGDDFYVMLGKIILTGIKWSALTFLLGILFSAAAAGLVALDRSKEKQKLEKLILENKKERELRLELLKKESDEKEKSITENFNDRIETNKKKIEELQAQQIKTEKFLTAQAEEKIKPIADKIDSVYPL